MDFTLDKAEQTALSIKGGNVTKTYCDAPFKLKTEGGLGTGSVTYEVSDPSVASVDIRGNVTILGAGTAQITAHKAEDSDYAAAKSEPITLTVQSAKLKNATVKVASDNVYSGSAVIPNIEVNLKDTTLVEGKDYTVSYKNNTNVGTATAIITGIGSCTGERTAEFSISPLTPKLVVVSKIGTKTYTGKDLAPDVAVSADGRILSRNTDYTVSYQNSKNPGSASVIITGIGNYRFSTSTQFDIAPKAIKNLKLKRKKKAISVKFKKSFGASGYKIEYAQNRTFKNAKSKNIKKTSCTVKAKSQKTVYVRVTPYVISNGKKILGKPCKAKSIKIKR